MHGQTTLKFSNLFLRQNRHFGYIFLLQVAQFQTCKKTTAWEWHEVYRFITYTHVSMCTHARTHVNTVDTRICVEKPRKCTKNARSQTETGNSLIRKAADYLNSAFVGSGISGSNPAWHISIQAAKFPKSWNEKRSHFHLPRWLVVTFVPNPRVHRCVCIALARALKFCCRRN